MLAIVKGKGVEAVGSRNSCVFFETSRRIARSRPSGRIDDRQCKTGILAHPATTHMHAVILGVLRISKFVLVSRRAVTILLYFRINEWLDTYMPVSFWWQIQDFSELYRTTGDEKIDLTGRGYGD